MAPVWPGTRCAISGKCIPPEVRFAWFAATIDLATVTVVAAIIKNSHRNVNIPSMMSWQ